MFHFKEDLEDFSSVFVVLEVVLRANYNYFKPSDKCQASLNSGLTLTILDWTYRRTMIQLMFYPSGNFIDHVYFM